MPVTSGSAGRVVAAAVTRIGAVAPGASSTRRRLDGEQPRARAERQRERPGRDVVDGERPALPPPLAVPRAERRATSRDAATSPAIAAPGSTAPPPAAVAAAPERPRASPRGGSRGRPRRAPGRACASERGVTGDRGSSDARAGHGGVVGLTVTGGAGVGGRDRDPGRGELRPEEPAEGEPARRERRDAAGVAVRSGRRRGRASRRRGSGGAPRAARRRAKLGSTPTTGTRVAGRAPRRAAGGRRRGTAAAPVGRRQR